VGKVSRGQLTFPGYEHLQMEVAVQKIEPERFFSYTGILMRSTQG